MTWPRAAKLMANTAVAPWGTNDASPHNGGDNRVFVWRRRRSQCRIRGKDEQAAPLRTVWPDAGGIRGDDLAVADRRRNGIARSPRGRDDHSGLAVQEVLHVESLDHNMVADGQKVACEHGRRLDPGRRAELKTNRVTRNVKEHDSLALEGHPIWDYEWGGDEVFPAKHVDATGDRDT
jgi:hypothetical protein